MNPPQQHLLPITPQINPRNQSIQIALPISDIPITSPPHLTTTPRKHLLTHMITPPTRCSIKLWDNIIPHSHLHTLHDRIATGHQITIVSDALMNAANNSCFAWIIATTQNEWMGTSPIPGPAEDNHTGQAKAYGVLTALQFLCHYLNHYPTNYSLAKSIKVYCDNQGILQ